MKYLVRILAPTLIFLSFLQVLPATGQEKKGKEPWKGKLADGTVVTEKDLVTILIKNIRWLVSDGKKGEQANLSKANLSMVVLGKAILDFDNLNKVDRDRFRARLTDLIKGDLDNAELGEAVLREALMTKAVMGLANLRKANLTEAILGGANLTDAYLEEANLTKAKLWRANLTDAYLEKADLTDAELGDANLTKAKLGEANLTKANLMGANLTKAILRAADLTNAYLRNADLTDAYLGDANLTKANLWDANLTKANLMGANLIGADLRRADLTGAELWRADLTNAKLMGANLTKAILTRANLTRAYLVGADLTDAILEDADLTDAVYEPRLGTVPYIPYLRTAKNLFTLTFRDSPHGLIELRDGLKKAGQSKQEREITYAIERTKTAKLTTYTSNDDRITTLSQFIKAMGVQFLGWIKYFFIELTCQYGMTPWRPLLLLIFVSIPFFTVPYFFCLRKESKDGIWQVWNEKRIRDDLGETKPTEPLVFQGWSALKVAFYFSILSAFSIGWRELNVGNWIARVQRYEFNYRATGWARTVSGIQSLISVYLLALWALTYFSRPFG